MTVTAVQNLKNNTRFPKINDYRYLIFSLNYTKFNNILECHICKFQESDAWSHADALSQKVSHYKSYFNF